MMKRYAMEIGLNKPLYPNLWRATSLTHMAEQGLTIPELQAQSGHADYKSLQTYIRLSKQYKKESYLKGISLDNIPPEPPKKPEPNIRKDTDTDNAYTLFRDGLITAEQFRKLLGKEKPEYIQ